MMMNKIFVFLLLISFQCFSQNEFEGTWRGILYDNLSDAESNAQVVYLEINKAGDSFTGFSRIELLNQKIYIVKDFSVLSAGDNEFNITEKYLKEFSNDRNTPKCKLDYRLKFDEKSGFLKGNYRSIDCKRLSGKILLYKFEGTVSKDTTFEYTHYWVHQLFKSIKKSYPSPPKLQEIRNNFTFKPIYFNHDESVVLPEFRPFLDELAMLLDAISDLRLLVVGHTDAVGTDAYNIGLSKRRAKAIRDYFKEKGVPADKLEIDFKGEREPVDSNNTPEGKQRNRRVDFSFI